MNNRKVKINGDELATSSPSILGTFEGECADSNITNLNGLDITRPVWETVFESEEYKKGIELGHYIGFLGHPEDPNCMDFEHACIVMTEGHIDDDGKIQGKFNLIDTPVGRIVKTFTDAGVKFGISVRGAGDIMDNSVDPDTFVFRGFDLVAFPAYPDSIPTFTEVAASTDVDKRKKYKAVCAAVKKDIDGLNTVESVDILQKHFAKQSDEYKMLQDKKDKLEDCNCKKDVSVKDQQYDGIMKLYLEQMHENKNLRDEVSRYHDELDMSMKNYARASRKLKSVERIFASQLKDIQDEHDELIASNNLLRDENKKYVKSARDLEHKYDVLKERLRKNSEELSKVRSDNLKYKQKIESASGDLKDKESVISSLRTEINETVRNISANETKVSNLDAVNRRLKSEIKSCKELLAEYQDAYADIFANAVGVHLDNISVSDSTSVEDLRRMISGSASINASMNISSDPTPVDIIDSFDDDDLITL